MATWRWALGGGGALLMALQIFTADSVAQNPTPKLTTLYNFRASGDGAEPVAGVVIGSGGVLYGTTDLGGTSHRGTVFSLTPPTSPAAAWTESVLYSFSGYPGDGAYPDAGVVVGAGGVLYGTTYYNGASNLGTVFSLAPPASPGAAWTETVIHTFAGAPTDGSDPTGGLVIGSGGILYGTTYQGGAYGAGTVFSVTPPKFPGGMWTETVLYNFSGGSDGLYPNSLATGSGGAIYGTTFGGGTSSFGTVFSLTPASAGGAWTEAVLYNFGGGSDGATPQTGVAIGIGRVLYGTTANGGSSNGGTVFSLKPPASAGGGWTETVIHDFPQHADYGYAAPVPLGLGNSGVLYGAIVGGGGALFALKPPASPGGSWTETLLHSFTGGDGKTPNGLVIGSGGVLYGTTTVGGTSNAGTVFALQL